MSTKSLFVRLYCTAVIHCCKYAECRGGIQTTIERGDTRSALREADVGSRAIVVGDEEDAIAAAQHKFVAQLVSSADAGRKIGVGGIVHASVAAGVEDQFARNVKSNRGADGVGGGKVEKLLRVVPFRRSGLDFIAQAESEGELACRFPSVLYIPAEKVFIGGWEFVETRLILPAPYTDQEGG